MRGPAPSSSRRPAERADERAAELAHHFALAATVAPTAEKALRFCLVAGRRAAALSAHRDALRHYTRAYELLEEHGTSDQNVQLLEVLEGRGTAEWNLWRWEPLIADFQRVLELTDDPVRRGLARSAIGFARQQRGDTAAAMADYAAALDELAAVPDRPDAVVPRFRLRVEQAYIAFLQGRFADMLRLGEGIMHDAQPLARPLLTFWGHNVQALAHMGSGHVAQSMQHAETGCAVAAQTGDELRLAVAEANFGVVCCLPGKYAAALPHLERAVSLYRESAAGHRAANAIHWLGRVALANGNLRLAAEHPGHARALAVEEKTAGSRIATICTGWCCSCEPNGARRRSASSWRCAIAGHASIMWEGALNRSSASDWSSSSKGTGLRRWRRLTRPWPWRRTWTLAPSRSWHVGDSGACFSSRGMLRRRRIWSARSGWRSRCTSPPSMRPRCWPSRRSAGTMSRSAVTLSWPRRH